MNMYRETCMKILCYCTFLWNFSQCGYCFFTICKFYHI